jgi:hypothetical protein
VVAAVPVVEVDGGTVVVLVLLDVLLDVAVASLPPAVELVRDGEQEATAPAAARPSSRVRASRREIRRGPPRSPAPGIPPRYRGPFRGRPGIPGKL